MDYSLKTDYSIPKDAFGKEVNILRALPCNSLREVSLAALHANIIEGNWPIAIEPLFKFDLLQLKHGLIRKIFIPVYFKQIK